MSAHLPSPAPAPASIGDDPTPYRFGLLSPPVLAFVVLALLARPCREPV